MADFYRPLPWSIEWQGCRYNLTPAFDNVLNMYEVIEDADIYERLELMFYYLTDGSCPKDVNLLQEILNLLFPKQQKQDAQRSFDFIQDGEYIYSAFMQAYGIDLVEEQGKLHWWKFNALLQGLPSNTRFMEIVEIRTRPLPKATKYNGEEISQLVRLKAQYALKVSEEERQKNLQRGFRKMADLMRAMANEGKS